MAIEIVDPDTTDIAHLSAVDVKFSGVHIGGGIYFSANHNPGTGATKTAIPQRGLDGEAEAHATDEVSYTLPDGDAPWTAYREGAQSYLKAGYDMSMQIGARLESTGAFYDGPAASLLIANNPDDLFGTVTITGYPNAKNSLDGTGGTLHSSTGTLSENGYTSQNVDGDAGGYFTIRGAEAVAGMSGGGNFLAYDADGDGQTETYLIATSSRAGTAGMGDYQTSFVQSTSFSPHYADLASTIEALEGDDARTADDFSRMTLLSAQKPGATDTTVYGQFFHEDIYGGVNDDTLYGGGGNDRLFGGAGNDILDGGAGDDVLDGGAGVNVLTGGAGADFFVGSSFAGAGHHNTITDFDAGRDTLDLGGYFENFSAMKAAATDREDGSMQIDLPAQAGGGTIILQNVQTQDLTASSVNVICFCDGTMILTAHGEVAIETLKPGDLVITRHGVARPLRAVQHRRLDHPTLVAHPNLWPVSIAPGALGRNVPARTLRVSPQHRILVQSPIARRMAGQDALIAAKTLLALEGVTQHRPDHGTRYIHLVFDAHEIIRADGCWSESFYPGKMALQTLPQETAREYREIFGLVNMSADAPLPPAAPLVAGRKARQMVERHMKNQKDLQHA
ncbi:hypothetical protein ERN12_11655 [Rhodobacteraceae bacterium]|nr:hypothetical protein ERN12_11655 [Paracoccaceae bacterium]